MNVLRENKRKAILLGEDNNALVWLIIINTVIFAMLSFIEIIYKMSYDREYVAMQIFHSQISDWFTLSCQCIKAGIAPMDLAHLYVLSSKFDDDGQQSFMALVFWFYPSRTFRK